MVERADNNFVVNISIHAINSDSIIKADTAKIKNDILVFKNDVSVDDKTGLTLERSDSKNESLKQTKYVVQIGDTVEKLVEKSIKAQNLDSKDSKTFEEVKTKFLETNKSKIKQTKQGHKYLLASSTVLLDGDIDVSKNKNAKEVQAEYEKINSKKLQIPKEPMTLADSTEKPDKKFKPIKAAYKKGIEYGTNKDGYDLKKYSAKNGDRVVEFYKHGKMEQVAFYKKDKSIQIFKDFDPNQDMYTKQIVVHPDGTKDVFKF